jgi:hypothetical protein
MDAKQTTHPTVDSMAENNRIRDSKTQEIAQNIEMSSLLMHGYPNSKTRFYVLRDFFLFGVAKSQHKKASVDLAHPEHVVFLEGCAVCEEHATIDGFPNAFRISVGNKTQPDRHDQVSDQLFSAATPELRDSWVAALRSVMAEQSLEAYLEQYASGNSSSIDGHGSQIIDNSVSHGQVPVELGFVPVQDLMLEPFSKHAIFSQITAMQEKKNMAEQSGMAQSMPDQIKQLVAQKHMLEQEIQSLQTQVESAEEKLHKQVRALETERRRTNMQQELAHQWNDAVLQLHERIELANLDKRADIFINRRHQLLQQLHTHQQDTKDDFQFSVGTAGAATTLAKAHSHVRAHTLTAAVDALHLSSYDSTNHNYKSRVTQSQSAHSSPNRRFRSLTAVEVLAASSSATTGTTTSSARQRSSSNMVVPSALSEISEGDLALDSTQQLHAVLLDVVRWRQVFANEAKRLDASVEHLCAALNIALDVCESNAKTRIDLNAKHVHIFHMTQDKLDSFRKQVQAEEQAATIAHSPKKKKKKRKFWRWGRKKKQSTKTQL